MPDSDSAYHTRAHAKLNLALAVGPAVDEPGSPIHGYHPICSYMHGVDLSDAVEIERLGAGETSVYDIAWDRGHGSREPVGWAIEHDLAVRAHRAIETAMDRVLPVRVRITKSIPAGGGLGGGSSDAAAVLTGINKLFGLGLSDARLCEISATLGSDVAFFIDAGRSVPRAAIVEGFGERIERQAVGHGGTAVTLIFPPFGCETGTVYRAFDSVVAQEPTHEVDAARVRLVARTLETGSLFNDLARAAVRAEPRLGTIIDSVRAAIGQAVHVTGSGSTLFVLGVVDPAAVRQAAPGCVVRATSLC